MNRVERYCPGPGCDWKIVETNDAVDADMPFPWAGSLQESIHQAVTKASAERARIVEIAVEAHIRAVHDAVDPRGWVERTVAALNDPAPAAIPGTVVPTG